MTRKRILALAAGMVLSAAAPARADFFISPLFSMASGGLLPDGAKVTMGGQLGVIGDAPIGVEGDFGYTMKTRGGHGGDNFRTLTGAVLIAPRLFGSNRWRPYAAVGGGVIGAVARMPHLFIGSSDEVESAGALSAGGGVLGFLSDRVGVRLDARLFRAMLDRPEGRNPPQFIRVSGGIVITF